MPPHDQPHHPPYAVVVVHINLGQRRFDSTDLEAGDEESAYLTRAWHYAIPQSLENEIRLGQLVWVPFGRQYVQGLVVAFDATTPVDYAKDIDQIAHAEPVISQVHLELARWISEYYVTPLHRAYVGMLPPGITQKAVTVYEWDDTNKTDRTDDKQQLILDLLHERGPLSAKAIAAALEQNITKSTLNKLIAAGQIRPKRSITPPRARPKLAPVYHLNDDVNLELDISNSATRQQEVAAYLRSRHEEGIAWVPRSEVAQQTGGGSSILKALEQKGLVQVQQQRIWRDPLPHDFVPVVPPPLTPDQVRAWQAIDTSMDKSVGETFLLHGITGSGKTEIYLRAVAKALTAGQGAIVLVPEIALTAQTIRRFGARFPKDIAIVHSRLSPGERYDQWQRIRSGELRLVIGSRSAIFAPLDHLALIVLDEEHEWSYKQDQMPHYHARDVAHKLAELTGATCILGTATPSLETAYRAERGEYKKLVLPLRILGHRQVIAQQQDAAQADRTVYRPVDDSQQETLYAELPPVQIVDMRSELRQGNTSIFSAPLRQAINETLAAKEQIILFLNRRGAATFVMCRDCGHVLHCPRCNVPLTYHSHHQNLICHHCGYQMPSPQQCPACYGRRIRYFGAGTQKVEEMVRENWPMARITRWDLDTTGGKDRHQELLDAFIRGEADIMIGTQMIAKGLDLPRVTLVGVIAADLTLNLPDFRSNERTFQLLTQVAGRAGRSVLGGRVIMQTYNPQHPVIVAASHHDYASFYEREMAFRHEQWYPPYSQLIKLTYVHSSGQEAEQEAMRMHEILTTRMRQKGLPELDVIGPAPCFFARIRNKSRWQILLRGRAPSQLVADLPFPLGWRVDVDPVSLL